MTKLGLSVALVGTLFASISPAHAKPYVDYNRAAVMKALAGKRTTLLLDAGTARIKGTSQTGLTLQASTNKGASLDPTMRAAVTSYVGQIAPDAKITFK